MSEYIETSMCRYPAKFVELLKKANDETIDERLHNQATDVLWGFKLGWEAAGRGHLNGDYYYMEIEVVDRPMCCGVFSDWKHKPALEGAKP